MPTKLFIILFLIFTSAISYSKETKDSALFIVHFEIGPNWNQSLAPQQQSKFKEHSANLNSLRSSGQIMFGARYADLGVIILKASSLGSAKELLEADPGVQSGIFNFRVEALMVFYPWKEKN